MFLLLFLIASVVSASGHPYTRCCWGCPGTASALGMFADARVDCFYTTMRKRCASLGRRFRTTSNTILSVFANRFDSKLLDSRWQDNAEGGLHIGSGRVKRLIATNVDQAKEVCLLPNGKNGRCRPFRYCIPEGFTTDLIKFVDYLCVINQVSVGACCPDDLKRGGAEGLAGDLPATAPSEEQNEAVIKVTRAESRGCGLSTRQQDQVFGARQANPREWPWMASIMKDDEQHCGAVLITDQHVITAAHCTRSSKVEELYVRLGEYDFQRDNESRSYNFKVTEIRQHETYESSNNRNDIAILKLHRPAVFNTYVWPICLPPPNLQLTDKPAIVIGWGNLFYGGPSSDVLMEVTVPVWDHEKCVSSFVDTIFDENICAGGREGGKDACQHDSGGPLMYQLPSGRWTVIGVVSWGLRCGEPNHPGLYTRVDKYLGWIAQNARF